MSGGAIEIGLQIKFRLVVQANIEAQRMCNGSFIIHNNLTYKAMRMCSQRIRITFALPQSVGMCHKTTQKIRQSMHPRPQLNLGKRIFRVTCHLTETGSDVLAIQHHVLDVCGGYHNVHIMKCAMPIDKYGESDIIHGLLQRTDAHHGRVAD